MKDALALALIHFLWQGTLLALAGALLMRIARQPSVRYAAGVATMLAMLLAPVMTLVALRNEATAVTFPGSAGQDSGSPEASAFTTAGANARSLDSSSKWNTSSGVWVSAVVPTNWILSVWTFGVLVFSLRVAGGWTMARRLATDALCPVSEELQAAAAQLSARLNIRRVVRVCESAVVAVPMMIGWLRPVIVLPPAALAALPLSQIEALVAHELAHIRRHDYLVNLLQAGAETLCFYHPGVWWISREIRRHREDCCDDVAVQVCDRLTYVTALASLASLTTPQLALSATGGSLRDRVRRLIEPSTPSAPPKGAWIAMLPIVLVLSFVAPQAWGLRTAGRVTAVEPVVPVVAAAVPVEAPLVVAQEAPVEQERPATAAREQEEVREAARRAALEQAAERRRRELGLDTERAVATARARESAHARDQARTITERQVTDRVRQERLRNTARQVEKAEHAEELARMERLVVNAERTLARQRQLVEQGLATRNQLAESEERAQAARLQLQTARARLLHAEAEQGLRQREIAGRTLRPNLAALEASARLQPNDHVTITIAGEPDLPTEFVVRSDGSIRYPFLGAIRVQDSTAAQVQSVIQKLIADKGLARNAAVHVSAARIR